ncbi:phytanoyl-CoA dioxygenase family protein [Haliea sp.]|uniref:phytanoyl-CoA dioxygenase family protein n=1 Tax=Haliea sp. TaxID=1932666 RepID=UPI0035289DC9
MTEGLVLRLPTSEEVDTFWTDGVVCLRGALDPAAVLAMAPAVERLLRGSVGETMHDMSALGAGLAAAGSTVLTGGMQGEGRFVSGTDHWRIDEDCRAFALERGLAALAGTLLRSRRVYLWEDSILVKEPDTAERTAWHQDMGYFHASGEQVCTTWIPLDVADAETGAMSFVRGSHRDGALYRPNWFVSQQSMEGTEGLDVPDVEALARAGRADLVQYALGPGDLTVHHARTLHAAGGNLSKQRRRRAISIRYCGDDARYHFRPGAPRKPHHDRVQEGDPLGDPDCPLVWQRSL